MMSIVTSAAPATTERHRLLWRIYKAMAGTYTFPDSLHYTAALLLLRTITTGWHAQQAIYRQRYGADSRQTARMMMFYRFQLPETCSFDYLLLRRNDNDLPALATGALQQLDARNPDTLQGIFHAFDLDNTRPDTAGTAAQTIRLALKYLSHPAFDTDTGDAFQYLLEKLTPARENKAKALFVPPAVSNLVAQLAAPRAGERICDPFCGCGAVLIPTLLHIRTHRGSPSHNFSAYGQEHHDAGLRLARLHAHLHGLAGVRLEPGNSIATPCFYEASALRKFDVVVTNLMRPALDFHHRFGRALPSKSKGDYAYIQHILDTLAPEGRAVIVLAQHTLSRGGVDARIRQSLVKANVIDAIIALPVNLFPDTSAATALLILRPARIRSEILFIDARQHFQSGRKQHMLRPPDITRIAAAYVRYESQNELAVCVPPEEIARHGFNLSAAPYLHREIPATRTDRGQLQQELNRLHQKLQHTRNTLDALLNDLRNNTSDTTRQTRPYTLPHAGDILEDPRTAYGTRLCNVFAEAIQNAIPYIPSILASVAGTAIQAVYRQRIIRDWSTNADWQRETDGRIEHLLYTLATEEDLRLSETVCGTIRSVCREAATRFFR
jgi:type I restriction enzyme M protein